MSNTSEALEIQSNLSQATTQNVKSSGRLRRSLDHIKSSQVKLILGDNFASIAYDNSRVLTMF